MDKYMDRYMDKYMDILKTPRGWVWFSIAKLDFQREQQKLRFYLLYYSF